MSLEVRVEHDLAGLNTLGLPCHAARFVAPSSEATLSEALSLAQQEGLAPLVLGGGSNVILPSRLSRLVIQPAMNAWRWLEQGDTPRIEVDAGVVWHELVMAMAGRGLWGIENLALIPGHCGAAPIQNIGAYGVELADVLEAVRVVSLQDGRAGWMSADECAFGYRDSLFKRELAGQFVITGLILRLSRRATPRLDYGDLAQRVSAAPTPLEVARAVCATRREKLPDPAVLGNAGSFFTNPVVPRAQADALRVSYPDMPQFPQPDGVKLAAGWLIDQCGLKGWRHGHFGVHDRQALVLVHHGGGTAAELLELAEMVARRVEQRFGVTLQREPRRIIDPG
ncbi:UDP-N-acetylmuramate dehydrogenase [Halomonas almeriensis]|uniref:UDP-N-acetylmuramate dehydrogenase n=1 Tax=Halomonas almeriensis TaxID=308163 RepID=UPI0025B553A0|nr:UDP-N-acetylmuramate dehydrogenase [Halomonas almeriensis]MDN3552820.1 UDP-N-acetylmuramate dehydrogenase [Halomonas almeriensis]